MQFWLPAFNNHDPGNREGYRKGMIGFYYCTKSVKGLVGLIMQPWQPKHESKKENE
jgi:hypothetical protein